MADGIGFFPTKKTLYLSQGADFIHALTAPTGEPYPSGFTGRIDIKATKTASGVLAAWNPIETTVEQVDWNIQSDTATTGVDAMSTAGAKWFRLYAIFPSTPTDDYLWYYGPISWIG